MHPLIQVGIWSIPTYFIVISIDFCLLLIWLRFRSQQFGFQVKMALDVGIIGAVAGLIGARLFHVIYEYPEFYIEHPTFVFKLWEGGFVFLAGIFAGVIAGAIWVRKHNQNLLPWLDLFAPIMGLGYSLGRWACFFQGCCYGKVTESGIGVHFHNLELAGDFTARWPTQLIASAIEVVLVVSLLLFEKFKKDQRWPGQIFAFWLMGHGFNRMVMELLRDDPRGPLVLGLGISFWVAIALVVGGVFMILRARSHPQSVKAGR